MHITLTRSKSEALVSLDRINWDVGVANELFMDNSFKHIGYNIEIHGTESLTRVYVRTTEP